jgi:ferredoxin
VGVEVKVSVTRPPCTGHGRCYSLAPEVYGCDDEGYAVIENPEVPAGLEAQARLGAANCPEDAIVIEE